MGVKDVVGRVSFRDGRVRGILLGRFRVQGSQERVRVNDVTDTRVTTHKREFFFGLNSWHEDQQKLTSLTVVLYSQ